MASRKDWIRRDQVVLIKRGVKAQALEVRVENV